MTLFSFTFCSFINSKYIKDLSNIAQFDLELKKSNITSGMMLIYSTGCGHCHNFLPTYDLLAHKYNNKLLFFAMSVYSDYHKRMPRTSGVPYILFFSEGYFYNFKQRRTFDVLSSIIENNYLPKCKQITYKNIENVYYNIFMKEEKYKNLIIGFFDENSEEEIKKFRDENNLLNEEYLGLCYVCKDFNEIKENEKNASLFKYIENKMVVGYLKNNISKIFKWDNIINENNITNYEKFIKEDLESNYIDINEENKKYLINFLRNKKSLIFSYKTNDEKHLYGNYINEISNITKYKINYVLFNISNFNTSLFNQINENGLYEINEELYFIHKYNNYDELKSKLFKEYNISNSNYTNILNNELLIPEVKKEIKNEENDESDEFNFVLFFQILEKICVVLFTVVLSMALFFLYYNIYYKKVDQELINLYQNSH